MITDRIFSRDVHRHFTKRHGDNEKKSEVGNGAGGEGDDAGKM